MNTVQVLVDQYQATVVARKSTPLEGEQLEVLYTYFSGYVGLGEYTLVLKDINSLSYALNVPLSEEFIQLLDEQNVHP